MTVMLLVVALPALCLFALACWWLGAYARLRSVRSQAVRAHAAWQHMAAQPPAAEHKATMQDDALRTLAHHYVAQAHAWNTAAHQWPAALVARIMRWPDMEEACRMTGQPLRIAEAGNPSGAAAEPAHAAETAGDAIP